MIKVIEFAFRLRTIWAVFLALFVGGIMIAAAGHNPFTAYGALFHGAFIDYYGLGATLVKMSPILLAGLAVIIPLRAGLFNIGGEGQIYMGALCSTGVALYVTGLPDLAHFALVIVAGCIGGGLWALIPAILKAYRGINEVIVTILMNYVAINLVSYFVSGPMMQEGAPYPYSPEIDDHLFLSWIMPGTDVHTGIIMGLLLSFTFWFILKYSSVGIGWSTVGHNPVAAKYAGINVKRQILISMFVGGAVAGLAGTIEVIGLKYRLFHLFSPGYGYDGIVVAFLAGLNPIFLPFATLFLSGLKAGANVMQRAIGLESTIIEAIQGLVIIFTAASLALKFNKPFWERFLNRKEAPSTVKGDSKNV
ncbi:MAG TPA: ABC transporter permease [Roseobacter sp.]|uniref:ABC transporter permease n=1 Tax=marine sediment metagenome TaxID=412755 RepID=A0A0F9QWF4_9ZZZZ|nr:ABC transporter permease [Roseobacter sp.]